MTKQNLNISTNMESFLVRCRKYILPNQLTFSKHSKVFFQVYKYMDDGEGHHGDADIRLYGKLVGPNNCNILFETLQVIQSSVPFQCHISDSEFWYYEAQAIIKEVV